MRTVGHALLTAALTAACTGHPALAPRVVAPTAMRAVPALPLGVPAAALGTYFVAGGPLLALTEVNGRVFFVWPHSAAAVQVEKSRSGFTLQLAPPTPRGPDEDDRNKPDRPLPTRFELRPPTGKLGWLLEPQGWGTFAQQPNPWATRLTSGHKAVELERRDLRGLEQQARITRTLHLLRDQPGDELLKLTSNVDPDWIKDKGGVLAYLAEQLSLDVEELRAAAKPAEMSKLDHYVETAKAIAYKRGALWAASEDAFLTALAERLSHTGDKTVIGPGSLLRVDTRDRMGVLGCDLGILVPDPTENQGHEWAPFKPPAAGKRAGFSYALFVVQSGPPGSCGSLRPSEHAYPVRHGVYFLRLFSDAQAQIRGTQFLGYMASEIAIIKGASTAELLLMLRANNEEISHQAE